MGLLAALILGGLMTWVYHLTMRDLRNSYNQLKLMRKYSALSDHILRQYVLMKDKPDWKLAWAKLDHEFNLLLEEVPDELGTIGYIEQTQFKLEELHKSWEKVFKHRGGF